MFSGLTAAGVIVFAWLHRTDDNTKRRPPRQSGQPVRVLEVAEYAAVPRAVGYGVVEAQRNWQGLAEVGGKIVEANERLEVGRLIREGTILYTIDPGSYELEKTKTEATVKAVRAQIGELKAKEKSARANLKVEQKVLALARKDLERLQSLYNQNTVPLVEVEAAEREVLNAERSVQGYKNTLQELPASRKVLEANLQQQKAGVKGAALDLARTEIVAPFTMRLREVNAIEGQAVSAGQVLVTGDAVDVMEVPAQFPIASITPLRSQRGRGRRRAEAGDATELTPGDDRHEPGEGEVRGDEVVPAPASADDSTERGDVTGDTSQRRRGRWRSITAKVHLKSQGMDVSWPAEFRRFEGIDSTTHTMGVVVQIDQPWRRAGRGVVGGTAGDVVDAQGRGEARGVDGDVARTEERAEDRVRGQPRLSPGMHVEVELWGAPQAGCKAIPREALHNGVVHLADDGNRLELRAVEVAFTQEDYVCVTSGLAPGDRVILTDVVPAVTGMLLAPRLDDSAAERLTTATRGGQAES